MTVLFVCVNSISAFVQLQSPWNQYFQDDNLRREIKQDVDRTLVVLLVGWMV